MSELSTSQPQRLPPLYGFLGLAILTLCWIQFTGAWIWPPVRQVEWGVIETHADKPGAVLLQYPLWLLILGGLLLAVLKDGMTFVRAFTPFTVLLVIMLIASIFGLSMAASCRITLLWLLSALAGGVVASMLDRDTIFRALAAVIIVTMTLSVLSYLLLPEYGADRYYTRFVLRGVFQHKNTAGRVAALALTLVFVMRHGLSRRMFLAGLITSLLCLLLSESKTAWFSAALAIGFLGLVGALRRRMTPSLSLVSVTVVGLLLLLLVMSFAPLLAEAFGRDLTLTGRTTVWQAYLREIRHVFWLGAGPGNVTTVSPFTAHLSLELRAHGSIFSPHSFYIGTLGDIGIGGLVYTLLLFGYLVLWVPLSDRGIYTLGVAAVGFATLVGGLGETLDAAAPGSTWFLMAMFWMGHVLHNQAHHPADAKDDAAGNTRPYATQPPHDPWQNAQGATW